LSDDAELLVFLRRGRILKDPRVRPPKELELVEVFVRE